eukprot:scaffold229275_cov75-Cyclotella_meneghiniana.AAC.1
MAFLRAITVVLGTIILLDTSNVAKSFSSSSYPNLNLNAPSERDDKTADVAINVSSRRSLLLSTAAATFASAIAAEPTFASTDCFSDCLKNCKLIAPKDYCAQEDRTDGLSGSTSSAGGEVGILGTSTVVKGEDKPPSVKIPGLDFTSDKGKKLIGY